MLNKFVVVGRITSNLKELKESECILNFINVNVKTKLNEDNILSFKIESENVSNQIYEYCNKDDLIGIKGYINSIDNVNILIAERITFLTSKGDQNK